MNNFIMKSLCMLFIFLSSSFVREAFAQEAGDMMEQFKAMSAGTEKNFPKELEALMPKGFTIKTKGFVYKETADMYLLVALAGSRENDAYRKGFCLDSDIEIGVFAYNPASSAGYVMKDQMPAMLEQKKKAYKDNFINENASWEKGPVQVMKIDKADVYLQKGVRKNVDLPDFKQEDQVYYFVQAVMLHKTAMLDIRLIYYPLKPEGARQSIYQIIKTCLATNFEKYMK
jgi:hypothetical protein